MTGATPTPATTTQLLARLRAQLPAALPTSMSAIGGSATAPDDLFEAYIFGLILEAAKIAGYSIEICDHNGPASKFHLRRGPGRIYSPGSPTLFTHARLTVGVRPPLEVHSGVAMVGKSKVSHEADVLVLPSSIADRCRSARVDPPSHSAFLAIEAKYWTKPVQLKTGREFLGLRRDSSTKAQVFVCTIADASATALLAGTQNVEYDDGVLPYLHLDSCCRDATKFGGPCACNIDELDRSRCTVIVHQSDFRTFSVPTANPLATTRVPSCGVVPTLRRNGPPPSGRRA